MNPKRPSNDLIANPLVKKRNLQWTLETPHPISESRSRDYRDDANQNELLHSTAAIEAGAAHVTDHLARFSADLASHVLLHPRPLVTVPSYASLYASNANTSVGAHFVIHQHDHPVAGTHYDLRLQINPTSSVSWAIMYGLPGDPNSVRLNRNATETRIHSLWNHLIETASADTGSLLIWDTGTFTVLPRRSKHAPAEDPASQPTSPSSQSPSSLPSSQQSLLEAAFHSRKIRLRLHGSKLPDPYVLNIRLTRSEDAQGRAKTSRTPRRRRLRRRQPGKPELETTPSCSSDEGDPHPSINSNEEHLVPKGREIDRNAGISALDRELRELEDEHVRQTNAYPGADNTIGSIHQRKWYLSLDRRACGFVPRRQGRKITWHLPVSDSSSTTSRAGNVQQTGMQRLTFPFYVRGVPHERSVVTARRGEDIMRDEGVRGFIPRKGWTPVLK